MKWLAIALAQVTFDPALLHNARGRDLRDFESARQLGGTHGVDVWRNGELLGRRSVRFDGAEGDACFDTALVEWLGVDALRLSGEQRDAVARAACATATTLHPSARAEHDRGTLALHVSIPQALLATRDALRDPATFDAGIDALRVDYAANFARHASRDVGTSHAGSLRMDIGANAGEWRLRHRGLHAWWRGGRESSTLDTVLSRDVLRFDAQIALGDFQASGMLFDAWSMRGLRFQSDDRMVPASLTHASPLIRGVADSNARVQVRQRGRLLRDTQVPPGPFAFDDLRPLARGGELEVRIVEADGRERRFVVPHAMAPGLLRRGRRRFGVVAGHAREPSSRAAPIVALAFESGVRDHVTLRMAAQATNGYAHTLVGLARASPSGAWSLDRSHARGSATRAAWTSPASNRGLSFEFGAWRRHSREFRTLQEVLSERTPDHRERHRVDASLLATLGDADNVRFSLVDRRSHASTRSAQLAWSRTLGRPGALVQAMLEHGPDPRATLALTLPLHIGATTAFAQTHASSSRAGNTLHTGIGGAFDARNGWNLGIAQGQTTTASASVAHHGRAGRIDVGASASRTQYQWSASGEGSVVVHAHGVTFGTTLGETVALVRATHGAGARVLHAPHVTLDRRGHALVPHLSPYRRNRVGIDTAGAPPDASFDWTERDIVPRAGAIVDVPLPSARNATRFVRVIDHDATPAAFGSRLVDASGATRALVGRDGLARVPVDDAPLYLDDITQPCTPAQFASDPPTTTCARSLP